MALRTRWAGVTSPGSHLWFSFGKRNDRDRSNSRETVVRISRWTPAKKNFENSDKVALGWCTCRPAACFGRRVGRAKKFQQPRSSVGKLSTPRDRFVINRIRFPRRSFGNLKISHSIKRVCTRTHDYVLLLLLFVIVAVVVEARIRVPQHALERFRTLTCLHCSNNNYAILVIIITIIGNCSYVFVRERDTPRRRFANILAEANNNCVAMKTNVVRTNHVVFRFFFYILWVIEFIVVNIYMFFYMHLFTRMVKLVNPFFGIRFQRSNVIVRTWVYRFFSPHRELNFRFSF